MEKVDHGKRLREAMATRATSRKELADALGVDVKTITNWRSGSTLPSEHDRTRLRKLFGPYDHAGDPVEAAVRSSELVEWRQDAVLSVYKKNLYEQRGGGVADVS